MEYILMTGHASDDFVAALAVMLIFGAPIAAYIVHRVLVHQERIEYLRRGMVPPLSRREARRAARAGMTMPPPPPNFTAAPPSYVDPSMMYAREAFWAAQVQLRKGITLTLIGLAILIGLSFINIEAGHPGPWLIGGLVPMFAGIAQIIIAVLSGARFGAPQAFSSSAHRDDYTQQVNQPPPSSAASAGSPFGFRPDPRVRPIEPPGEIRPQ
ncbi:MAG: hypothetical protein DLM50_05560 [Candidatus Meridianibacter frigidus]|nr:MAG: hypothetical protein DLM50_05560 [Candidatus Eremiobacteraeota bacterium]